MIIPIKKSSKIQVPVRADIAGAFSDIPYYLNKYKIPTGEVVNISLPVYIEMSAEIGRQSEPITLLMPDLNEKISGDLIDLAVQEKNNASQVAMHFIRLFSLDSAGLKITISSGGKIPPASGLGTSSAVGVGLVRLLADLYGIAGINAPEFNYLVEQAMGVRGGKQDCYASFIEGINYLKFYGPDSGLVDFTINFEKSSAEYKWLLDRSVVYFTGDSRSSGVANAKPEDQVKKDPEILTRIAKQAGQAIAAINNKNQEELAAAITQDRINRLELSSDYYNDKMLKMGNVGETFGFAHRACGAGAGGCMLFFGDGDKNKLITELNKLGGRRVC
jgi:galactokinase/mevalonate kinase-like predicted kinase